jgi:hypothetical protein
MLEDRELTAAARAFDGANLAALLERRLSSTGAKLRGVA